MSQSKVKMYGFYSQEHNERNGYFVYTTPNDHYVYVTAVYPDQNSPNYNWTDKKCVGEVRKCVAVRRGKNKDDPLVLPKLCD